MGQEEAVEVHLRLGRIGSCCMTSDRLHRISTFFPITKYGKWM